MPAPYVIAHWQVGHTLRAAGVPLGPQERAAVYLTNALTGWVAPQESAAITDAQRGIRFTYPPLAEERDEAARVKQARPILVVLGNPPYNAFAGTSPAEESGLVKPYKEGLQRDWGIRKFNLDDLYVRFFRVAERRIADGTGRGLICFISNHSWLSYPSYVVMRRRLLGEFDRIWVDNLHGDRKITERGPDGQTSETIFAISGFSPGIQQGTAISLLVRKIKRSSAPIALFNDSVSASRADERRAQLLMSLKLQDFDRQYELASPAAANRFSLRPSAVAANYASWPALPQLAAQDAIPGLTEMRQEALIDSDLDALSKRMRRYFDVRETLVSLRQDSCGPVVDMARFEAAKARENLLRTEQFNEMNLRRYHQRAFEEGWCYYTKTRPIWNEPRPDLAALIGNDNPCLVSRAYRERPHEGPHILLTRALPDYHLLRPNCSAILFFRAHNRANLSPAARTWLAGLGLPNPDADRDTAALPWYHAIAVGYAPAWLAENSDGIRQGWPRVPLPDSPDLLQASAALGARVAALLDPDTPVPGITSGTIVPAIQTIAVPTKRIGATMTEADRALTAGWGYAGKGGAVIQAADASSRVGSHQPKHPAPWNARCSAPTPSTYTSMLTLTGETFPSLYGTSPSAAIR